MSNRLPDKAAAPQDDDETKGTAGGAATTVAADGRGTLLCSSLASRHKDAALLAWRLVDVEDRALGRS